MMQIPNAGQSMPTPAGTSPQAAAGQQQQYNGPPPGVYLMRATDAELGYTAGSETEPAKPQVAVLLEFADGNFKGTSLTWYGFFTDKTRESTIRALRTLGWVGNDLSDLSTVRGEGPCTIQSEADLEGVVRAKVRFIGGGIIAMKNAMTEDQKKAFAASMQQFAAGVTAAPPKDKEKEKNTANGPNPSAPAGGKFF